LPAPPTADAQQSGVAQETVKAAARNASMSVQEAQMVLGVGEHAPWAEVLKVRARLRARVLAPAASGLGEVRAGYVPAAQPRPTLPYRPAPPGAPQRYRHLFDVNEKHGSFYLQSKVYRAWEALDEEYTRRGLKPPGAEEDAAQQGPTGSIGSSDASSGQQQQQQQQQQAQQEQQQGSTRRR
jgi:import inner membrane translocase subunit TIM16